MDAAPKPEQSEAATEEQPITLAEFLQTIPPDVTRLVGDAITWRDAGHHKYASLETPVLLMHCDHEVCGGVRTFETTEEHTGVSDSRYDFLSYRCENCKKTTKTFALFTELRPKSAQALMRKLGENTPFGPPIPARAITLIGGDRDLFLKGYKAETRGLGIGAYAYYRRVLDQQRTRIIEQLKKVAVQLGTSPAVLKLFDEALKETQFTTAIEKIKDAIPESLRIKNENPLILLYETASQGLHRRTDEECLELATDLRVVLTELAERISTALRDDQELKLAVDRLRTRNKT
jgi:hypothetical protein